LKTAPKKSWQTWPLLIGPGLLLTACATSPGVPSKPPEVTQPPALSQPIPTQKYLDSAKTKRVQISINSRGDIESVSYLSSVSTANGKRFIDAWRALTKLKICGVDADAKGCRGVKDEPGPTPPPSPCKEAYEKVGLCLFRTSYTSAPSDCYQAAGKIFACLEEKYP